MTAYIVHIGYVITLCAFLLRDVLWIRATLAVAQSIVSYYAYNIVHVQTIAVWNFIFLCINVLWVIRILRERRAVVIPEDLKALYARHFSSLSPKNFLKFWAQGQRVVEKDRTLAREGQVPESLFFVLRGTVRVTRGDQLVTELTPGYFVAEMSLITNHPATADAVAVGEVELMRWPSATMRSLQSTSPELWSGVQAVLGYDLVEKIKRGTADQMRVAASAG